MKLLPREEAEGAGGGGGEEGDRGGSKAAAATAAAADGVVDISGDEVQGAGVKKELWSFLPPFKNSTTTGTTLVYDALSIVSPLLWLLQWTDCITSLANDYSTVSWVRGVIVVDLLGYIELYFPAAAFKRKVNSLRQKS